MAVEDAAAWDVEWVAVTAGAAVFLGADGLAGVWALAAAVAAAIKSIRKPILIACFSSISS
jgi:hypothetical protein